MGYDLSHCHCFVYVGEEACCYSLEKGAASTPHSIFSVLQHLLTVFEFARSFALDQVELMNLEPLHHLLGKALKIGMISIYVPTNGVKLMKPKMVVSR